MNTTLRKATSGAPICSGMMTLAKPANSGVANISSMIVPCMVNIGIRNIGVRGRRGRAYMLPMMVVMKLTEPRMDDNPSS